MQIVDAEQVAQLTPLTLHILTIFKDTYKPGRILLRQYDPLK